MLEIVFLATKDSFVFGLKVMYPHNILKSPQAEKLQESRVNYILIIVFSRMYKGKNCLGL